MNELTEQKSKEIMEILGTDDLTVKKWDEIVTADMITYPLADISSLGMAFSGVSTAFTTIGEAAKASGALYEAKIPTGAHLAKAKGGLIGAVVKDGKGVIGQARFKEVGKTAQAAGNISTIFMAMAIMAINKSLQNISENQKSILSFLETDKETQLKGDLITLSDIISEYQHNWNNQQYLSNREMQTLDIKRNAEQNILFYREMIERKFGKKQFIHFDTAKTLNDVENKFKYYQLALYLYSFSSFLDVVLLQNFDKAFLNDVARRVKNYSLEYGSFYDKALESIEEYAGTSVQSRALQGLSVAGKFVGKQIAKIPDKANKIKVDDKLMSGSKKLEKIQSKSISDTTSAFSVVKDSGISMFIEKIDLLNAMHNKPMRIAVDENNLYLLQSQTE